MAWVGLLAGLSFACSVDARDARQDARQDSGDPATADPAASDALKGKAAHGHGVLAIELTESPFDTSASRRAAIGARFLRTRGAPSAAALRLIDATLDVPSVGGCMQLSRGTPGRRPAPNQVMELVPLAPVSLTPLSREGQPVDSTIPLQPRLLPDVANVLSGYVYTAQFDVVTDRYAVRVEGETLLTTSVGALAPVRANGLGVSAPLVVTDTPVVLTWRIDGSTDTHRGTPADAHGTPPADVHAGAAYLTPSTPSTSSIVVDVVGPSGITRCAVEDLGEAALPSWAFAERGTVTLRRIREERWSSRSIDVGILRWDSSLSFAYQREMDAKREAP
jgi:hypothetical protein